MAHPHSFEFLTARKGNHFIVLIVVTAAGVSRLVARKRPRTSFIVQLTLYVRSFENRGNILRNQIILYRFRLVYSKDIFAIWTPFGFI